MSSEVEPTLNDLLGPTLLTKNDKSLAFEHVSTNKALTDGKEFVLLYFSASWCGPCRQFTPQLKQFYNHVNNNNSNVEIIFVSLDRTIESFYQYYSTMPWLALPFELPNGNGNNNNKGKKQVVSEYLSSLFWVVSIPTLIVLNKDGLYVTTNNAKAQVSNAIRAFNGTCKSSTCGGDCGSDKNDPLFMLLDSWRKIPHVPIDEAYFGFIPSIYSYVKNGYNYIMGNEKKSKTKAIGYNYNNIENNNEEEQVVAHGPIVKKPLIPHTIILSFFRKAITKLNLHPKTNTNTNDNAIDNNSNVEVPVSLDTHRRLLLEEQIQALKEAVLEYNNQNINVDTHPHMLATAAATCDINNPSSCCVTTIVKNKDKDNQNEIITIGQVQESLTLLGQKDYTTIKDCSEESSNNNNHYKDEIAEMMVQMNNAARSAFVRSVLWSEVMWVNQQYQLEHYNTKSNLIDYNQVKRKLRQQSDDNIVKGNVTSVPGSDSDDKSIMERTTILEYCGLVCTAMKIPEVKEYLLTGKNIFLTELELSSNDLSRNHDDTPQQRLVNLQNMLLCAVGYEPSYGGSEIRRYVANMQKGRNSLDEELKSMLSMYQTTLQEYVD